MIEFHRTPLSPQGGTSVSEASMNDTWLDGPFPGPLAPEDAALLYLQMSPLRAQHTEKFVLSKQQ